MDEQDIDIGGILNVLRRRVRLIAATLIACLGLAGIAILVLTPIYSASTLVLVDPSRSNLIDPDPRAASAASDNGRVASQVEILRSDAVLLDVIAEQNLLADPEFGARPGLGERIGTFLGLGDAVLPEGAAALGSVLNRLKDAVSVERKGLTYIIAVRARSVDPQKAAELSIAIAQSYIEAQTQSKIDGILAAGAVLEARLVLARENIVRAQEELGAFGVASAEQPDSVDAGAGELPAEILTRLYQLQQAADLARDQYQALLARSSDLQVQAGFQIADSRIVSRALPPAEPSFPNTRLILALAGVAGLGLGVGLAFVTENFVGGFTSESQLNLVTRLPVVAELPFQRTTGESLSAADMVVNAPLSHYAESIRRARAGIDQHLRRTRGSAGGGAKGGAVIMVSSAVPGEGKTTLALSLARTYAQSGKATLIIDCDLRGPAIHEALGIAPEMGLFEYLVGGGEGETLASIIERDEETGLSVLVGSRRSDIATDQLIAGNAFARLIAAAIGNFEVVILDTPPVLAVVDGLYLSQYADAVAFVVRWSSSSQSEVRAALGRLEQARNPDAPVLCVLNRQMGGRLSYGKTYEG